MSQRLDPYRAALPPQDIVVLGAGGHAKVVAQSLRRSGGWHIVGFIDEHDPARAGEAFCGAAVLGGRAALAGLREQGVSAVAIAFGDNRARLALDAALAAQGWQRPAIVDPTAQVADDVRLGPGCYVAAGAIVEPGSSLGRQVIVNSAAVVCHDAVIGEGVHLCPASCLGGHVQVGPRSWIGIGSVLRDRVCIGADVVIGAGSLVLGDVPHGVVAYGHPAQVITKAQP